MMEGAVFQTAPFLISIRSLHKGDAEVWTESDMEASEG